MKASFFFCIIGLYGSQLQCFTLSYTNFIMSLGICADIAVSKYERWSSLAPLPFEVVVSAGQKAKEESWEKGE